MTRLRDNINSNYIENENSLNIRRGEFIEVKVENEDDIPFWKHLFTLCGITTKIAPASQTNQNRGKQELLKQINNLGSSYVICVDSDYDYLLQDSNLESKVINENPYIFQTYVYAVENFKCLASVQAQVMTEATLVDDDDSFDYEDFLEKYSKIIYDLFLYSVYHEKQNRILEEKYKQEYYLKKNEMAENELERWQNENKLNGHVFPINAFCNVVALNLGSFSKSNTQNVLNEVKQKVQQKKSEIEGTQINIEEFETQLSNLGLLPENTYLFMYGHTLFDNVLGFMKDFFEMNRQIKINQIKSISLPKDIQKNLNEYNNNIQNKLVIVRKSHTHYQNHFFIEKIKQDINVFWHNREVN